MVATDVCRHPAAEATAAPLGIVRRSERRQVLPHFGDFSARLLNSAFMNVIPAMLPSAAVLNVT